MTQPKAQVVYRKLAELKELPGNPRIIKKDQFEKLKQSIKDNADYFEARPIILSDRTGDLVILAGNQRYKAAKAIGMTEVPTILLPNLTEEREKEIIIRDNVENGDWDWDALANEWAKHNINVNAIAPGYMATNNTAQLRDDENRSAEILGRIPAGRWGTPEDMAGAAIFLASEASSYMNGFTIAVDGGWLAR